MKTLKLYISGLCILLLCLINACINDELEPIDPTKAQLEVYVYGTLSSNPRSDIKVSVHLTEDDAKDGKKAVVGSRYTDSDGNVTFRNLEPGQKYWIRAKPVIGYSTEETDELVVGNNYHSIDIL